MCYHHGYHSLGHGGVLGVDGGDLGPQRLRGPRGGLLRILDELHLALVLQATLGDKLRDELAWR